MTELISQTPDVQVAVTPQLYANLQMPTDLSASGKGRSLIVSLKEQLQDPWLQLFVAGYVAKTATRIATEGDGTIEKALVIAADSAVHWAGESVTSYQNLVLLSAVAGTLFYIAGPAKVIEIITRRQSSLTAASVEKLAEAARLRLEKQQTIREGRADLENLIGPHVQIDVGKSDPALFDLLKFFHGAGTPVVTFWDTENEFFAENPAWQRTNDNWTDKETLRRGDIKEAICAIMLISNGDDIFLSSVNQDPTRQTQDMTDNEAIEAIYARNAIRREMGLPPIFHILVTNPRRKIPIDVARKGDNIFIAKSVGQIIKERIPNVFIVDPDELVIEELARTNLPLELITNPERLVEYKARLQEVIDAHNAAVERGEKQNTVRIATAENGANTLSIFYGATDKDTIAQITSYGADYSSEGDMLAIINDPAKLNRLPSGVKVICVGQLVAQETYRLYNQIRKMQKIETT